MPVDLQWNATGCKNFTNGTVNFKSEECLCKNHTNGTINIALLEKIVTIMDP